MGIITERTLKRWRKEALKVKSANETLDNASILTERPYLLEMQERILRMTQELMDSYLLKKESK